MKSRGKRALRRRPARRLAKRYFYLFAEGANTERDYFKALGSTIEVNEVKIIYNGPLGVPRSVAAKAIEVAREKGLSKNSRKKLNSFEENDEVWAVFDRDAFDCYYDAKQMCEGAGVFFAYSDPCFEHWLNLHDDLHDAPCSRGEAQAKTKTILKGYDPKSGKTAEFKELMEKLPDAEGRAERQRENRRNEGNQDGNPSTNVYELTRKLRGPTKT